MFYESTAIKSCYVYIAAITLQKQLHADEHCKKTYELASIILDL